MVPQINLLLFQSGNFKKAAAQIMKHFKDYNQKPSVNCNKILTAANWVQK
jgi:hypothetical protein